MPDGSSVTVEYASARFRYVGAEAVAPNGLIYELTRQVVDRLILIERNNRRRIKQGEFDDPIVEKVDFIAKCMAQKWLCCICGGFMDPLDYKTEQRVSVEHDPAISVCNEHSTRTVHGAHLRCNVLKSHASDTPRAAKIRRVVKERAKHERLMIAKATLAREVYKRTKRAEKNSKLKSRSTFSDLPKPQGTGGGFRSRGFDKTKSRGFNGKVRDRAGS